MSIEILWNWHKLWHECLDYWLLRKNILEWLCIICHELIRVWDIWVFQDNIIWFHEWLDLFICCWILWYWSSVQDDRSKECWCMSLLCSVWSFVREKLASVWWVRSLLGMVCNCGNWWMRCKSWLRKCNFVELIEREHCKEDIQLLIQDWRFEYNLLMI